MKAREESVTHRRESPWRLNEAVRRQRIRRDSSRSLGVNLSEGLALSEFLSSFTGVCRRP